MSKYSRENDYIKFLTNGKQTVKELAQKLFVSEPTVRRDIIYLQEKGILICKRGTVSLVTNFPYRSTPLLTRQTEQTSKKRAIALKAISKIKDGDIIMLDSTSTAACLTPYLADFKKILVITNSLKTAFDLVNLGIKTIFIGGEIDPEYLNSNGPDAETILKNYNADVAFFSCKGFSLEKRVAMDPSIAENNIRRIMIHNSKRTYLLCDNSKLEKIYLNTICSLDDLDMVITD